MSETERNRLRADVAVRNALIERVLRDRRVRHDHAYPMEIGEHHCAGCDLEADLRAVISGGERG